MPNDVAEYEVAILEFLEWNIVVATSHDFIEVFRAKGLFLPQDKRNVRPSSVTLFNPRSVIALFLHAISNLF
jgi:hypothetical protein